MEVVQKASVAPGMCVFTTDIDGPFLDTGYYLNAETIGIHAKGYVHVPVVVTMGRAVGMVDNETHQDALDQISGLKFQVAQLERELSEASKIVDAVELIEKRTPKPPPTRKRKVAA